MNLINEFRITFACVAGYFIGTMITLVGVYLFSTVNNSNPNFIFLIIWLVGLIVIPILMTMAFEKEDSKNDNF